MRKYTARVISGSARAKGRFTGQVLENDVLIATFTRGAIRNGFVPPIETKFRTDASRARFESFADSLTVAETIEALAA